MTRQYRSINKKLGEYFSKKAKRSVLLEFGDICEIENTSSCYFDPIGIKWVNATGKFFIPSSIYIHFHTFEELLVHLSELVIDKTMVVYWHPVKSYKDSKKMDIVLNDLFDCPPKKSKIYLKLLGISLVKKQITI